MRLSIPVMRAAPVLLGARQLRLLPVSRRAPVIYAPLPDMDLIPLLAEDGQALLAEDGSKLYG